MSDEAHMEAGFRHRDLAAPQQWHGLAPDEELMAREDGPGREELRADLQEQFLVYCFADTRPEEWRTVASRAHAVIRQCFPGEFFGRDCGELAEIRGAERPVGGYALGDLLGVLWPAREVFAPVLLYYFPQHRRWLRHGCQNLYLIARNYQPGLVTRWDGEMTYEKLAEVFGELTFPLAPHALERARSRWSARAQQLITRPIQRAAGSAPAMFGKSATVREKYARAARGNRNRRGKSDE